jgi:hypothetical protein
MLKKLPLVFIFGNSYVWLKYEGKKGRLLKRDNIMAKKLVRSSLLSVTLRFVGCNSINQILTGSAL